MTSRIGIPSNLVPSDPQGSELLAIERSKATFNIKELTSVIYTESELKKFHEILSILQNDPFFDKSEICFMGRKELFKYALRKDKKLIQLIRKHNWDIEEIEIAEILLDLPGPTSRRNIMDSHTILFSNHAVVMARLLTNSKDHGPHPFIVQIRDLKTHEPLPGITIGDIGPKFGYNATDNGFILFDHIRIPRKNMLSKYSQVVKGTGEYLKPPNNKLSYGTMVLVRAEIILHARIVLARAATIAVRYSAVRRQFVDKDKPNRLRNGDIVETPVLDYTMQQYRLFPVIAQAYTCHFTGKAIINLYKENQKRISN
ncbi:1488_t:CDS:2, partial [Acaulospora colombiana]